MRPLRVGRIQRSSSGGHTGETVDGDTAARIATARQGGTSLTPEVATRFSSAFGHDVSKVRLHTGTAAGDLNRRIGARAFTTGNDVFFRDGLPNLSSGTGQHLLAHELTHTIQQAGGPGRRIQRIRWDHKGRRRKDEAQVASRLCGKESQKAVVERLLGLFYGATDPAMQRTAPSVGHHATFTKAATLLTRPDVNDIVKGFDAASWMGTLQKCVARRFGRQSFRTQYLTALIDNGGQPPDHLRFRLALGVGGLGPKSRSGDAKEALRIFYDLGRDERIKMLENHHAEIKTGLPRHAFSQVAAAVKASKADKKIESSRAIERDKTRNTSDRREGRDKRIQHEAELLDAQDSELAAALRLATEGESTLAQMDVLGLAAPAKIDKVLHAVQDWVQRADATSHQVFGDSTVIRRYVVQGKVEFGATDYDNLSKHFLTHLQTRVWKRGLNDGDRVRIVALVSAGLPGDVSPSAQVHLGFWLRPKGSLQDVKGCLRRSHRPSVSAALAELAGALEVSAGKWKTRVNRTLTSRRRRRVHDALDSLAPIDRDHLLAALEPADRDDALKKFEGFLSDAGFLSSHRRYLVSKFGEVRAGDDAVSGYHELLRLGYKRRLPRRRFSQVLAQLSNEELQALKGDHVLRKRLDEADPGTAGEVENAVGYQLDGPEIARGVDQWADLWAALINNTRLHHHGGKVRRSAADSKIYRFALRILDAGAAAAEYSDDPRRRRGSARAGSHHLRSVYHSLAKRHTPAARRLDGSGLGEALGALAGATMVGASPSLDGAPRRYDLISHTIGHASTAVSGVEADVDAICHTFEQLSGRLLFDEWTDVASATEGQGDRRPLSLRLSMRKARHEQLDQFGRLTNPEYFEVRRRFADHIAWSLRNDDRFQAAVNALVGYANTTQPRVNFDAVACEVEYLATAAEQKSLGNYCQWSIFSNKGALAKLAVAELSSVLIAIKTQGGSVDNVAIEKFADKRSEATRRAQRFVAAANRYSQWLHKVVNSIGWGILVAASMGAAGLGVVATNGIVAAADLFRRLVLRLSDYALKPGQSALAGGMRADVVMEIGLYGMGLVNALFLNLLREGFGVLDHGLPKLPDDVEYRDTDGKVLEPDALEEAFGFKGSSAAAIFTMAGADTIMAVPRKLTLSLAVLLRELSQGADSVVAVRNMVSGLNLADAKRLVDLIGLGPLESFISRAAVDTGSLVDAPDVETDQVLESYPLRGDLPGLDREYVPKAFSSEQLAARSATSVVGYLILGKATQRAAAARSAERRQYHGIDPRRLRHQKVRAPTDPSMLELEDEQPEPESDEEVRILNGLEPRDFMRALRRTYGAVTFAIGVQNKRRKLDEFKPKLKIAQGALRDGYLGFTQDDEQAIWYMERGVAELESTLGATDVSGDESDLAEGASLEDERYHKSNQRKKRQPLPKSVRTDQGREITRNADGQLFFGKDPLAYRGVGVYYDSGLRLDLANGKTLEFGDVRGLTAQLDKCVDALLQLDLDD